MASQAQRRAAQQAVAVPGTERSKPQGSPASGLTAARAPAARRSIGDIGTFCALGLFAVCLALAALHAVLVENQDSLDDLIEQNQLRQERIDQLQAEVAYLDSPEGLAEQAQSVGLVPAAELVVIPPVGSGLLDPPGGDPFDLVFSGWTPEPAQVQLVGGNR